MSSESESWTLRSPWTLRSRRQIYDNPWISVTHDEVLTPSGTEGIYGTVHFKNVAVGVIPIAEDGSTWLVGQWRYPLGRYSWEIVEGGGQLDEPAEDSARRELAEETGLRAEHLSEILRVDLSNSVSDESATAFVAWGLTQGAAEPEPTEQLQVRRVPLAQAIAMAETGEIRDALSVAALLRLKLMVLEGNLPPGLAPSITL